MSFGARLSACAAAIEDHFLTRLSGSDVTAISEAMRYAASGGKRLRGFLVMEAASLFDVPDVQSVVAATAIEAVHAYSLVHDDLPCMDDDDLRRGQPTVHIKWDEATAVLVGDALLTMAFELLADPTCHPDPAVRIDLTRSLAVASGREGMVLGQALDIAAESADAPLRLEEITTLQAKKTGALIVWSAEAGARLGYADVQPLGQYAKALGLAFQIADDVLDVVGDTEKAGKRLQKDAHAGKATFVSLLGLDGARARARELVDEAEAALTPYGSAADNLRAAARFVISREF